MTDEAEQLRKLRFELYRELFKPLLVKPAPVLGELADIVHSRSQRRSPKWKFRLAPTFIVRIQSKLTERERYRFECRAIVADDFADGRLLDNKPPRLDGRYIEVGFDLIAPTSGDGRWQLRPKRFRGADEACLLAIASIRAAFDEGRFDVIHAGLLLTPNCFFCGKSLRDPVSQARGIGPECAGTSSADLPWMRILPGPQQQLPRSQ